ncbi:MAG: nuclear transport factor 2 family protein [Hyphomicrobiales bacterium]
MRSAHRKRLPVTAEPLPKGSPSTAEERNIAVLKCAYAAWDASKGADRTVWTQLVAPAFLMHSLAQGVPPLEFTARICCPADLERYFEGLARDWSMNFFRIDRYVAQGSMVVAIGECSFTHRRTGKTVTTPKLDAFKFLNGEIVEVSELYDTALVMAAATPDAAGGAKREHRLADGLSDRLGSP